MKGQYFSFDAIVASVIFVLALVALLSYWHSVKSFLDYQNDPISKDAIRVSNLLFTPPSPSADCDTIEKFGLALSWSDRRVNSSLLNCAIQKTNDLVDPDAGPNWLHIKLGTQYMAALNITNVTGGPTISIGNSPPADVLHIVKIRRLATVVNDDGSTYLVTMDLSLYK
ncbi:MAG: hypothetical protein ABID61_04550 [Candidatus Micrarchaeota archaeon]